MNKFSKIIIIYNPNSTNDSRGNALRLSRKLKKIFGKTKVITKKTKYAGHAEELSKIYANKFKNPLIISASGDGGFNEVINGVLNSQNSNAVCSVLASGNANDHANALQREDLFKKIKSGKTRLIDVLQIQYSSGNQNFTRYGHSYIGLGLTPSIATELNRHDLNLLKSFKIVLDQLFHYKPFAIKRRGKDIRFLSIIFANIDRMAMLLTVSNQSQPNDGFFEIIKFPAMPKRKIFARLFKAVTIGLDTKIQQKSYQFEATNHLPIQIDGEVFAIPPKTKVFISIQKRRLKEIY